MSDPSRGGVRCGAVRSSIVSVSCFVRHLRLFFRGTPKTPLRVLGVVAFDTLHVLRYSRPLTPERVNALATFMDFEGCANAACDHKAFCDADYQGILHRLEAAGLAQCVGGYLRRLQQLESERPAVPGDRRRFADVRSYREAVARLSMGTAAAIALVDDPVDEGSGITWCDSDVEALYRILMQCQIIDDVLDYREDLAAGLPSFLTACASPPQALDLTAAAVRSYAGGRPSSSTVVFPLRLALFVVTVLTKLLVRVTCWHWGRMTYAGMVKVRD